MGNNMSTSVTPQGSDRAVENPCIRRVAIMAKRLTIISQMPELSFAMTFIIFMLSVIFAIMFEVTLPGPYKEMETTATKLMHTCRKYEIDSMGGPGKYILRYQSSQSPHKILKFVETCSNDMINLQRLSLFQQLQPPPGPGYSCNATFCGFADINTGGTQAATTFAALDSEFQTALGTVSNFTSTIAGSWTNNMYHQHFDVKGNCSVFSHHKISVYFSGIDVDATEAPHLVRIFAWTLMCGSFLLFANEFVRLFKHRSWMPFHRPPNESKPLGYWQTVKVFFRSGKDYRGFRDPHSAGTIGLYMCLAFFFLSIFMVYSMYYQEAAYSDAFSWIFGAMLPFLVITVAFAAVGMFRYAVYADVVETPQKREIIKAFVECVLTNYIHIYLFCLLSTIGIYTCTPEIHESCIQINNINVAATNFHTTVIEPAHPQWTSNVRNDTDGMYSLSSAYMKKVGSSCDSRLDDTLPDWLMGIMLFCVAFGSFASMVQSSVDSYAGWQSRKGFMPLADAPPDDSEEAVDTQPMQPLSQRNKFSL